MYYAGHYIEDATVYIPLNTVDTLAASITMSTDGTLKVYKNGFVTTITAGITFTEDVATGMHGVTIDMSADAAYTTEARYMLAVEGAEVDGTAINAWLGCWDCVNSNIHVVAALTAAQTDLDTITDTGVILAANQTKIVTEGYSTQGAAPTWGQMLCEIYSANKTYAKPSTTVSYYKFDDTTVAWTATIDDALNPTSHTRAT